MHLLPAQGSVASAEAAEAAEAAGAGGGGGAGALLSVAEAAGGGAGAGAAGGAAALLSVAARARRARSATTKAALVLGFQTVPVVLLPCGIVSAAGAGAVVVLLNCVISISLSVLAAVAPPADALLNIFKPLAVVFWVIDLSCCLKQKSINSNNENVLSLLSVMYKSSAFVIVVSIVVFMSNP